MGNCPSSFRAQFKPDHQNADNCQTDIILSPVMDKDNKSFEEKQDSEVVEIIAHGGTSNGTSATEVIESPIPLKAEKVDFHTVENTEKHYTSNFNLGRKTLRSIIRRGFPFDVSITLNRPYEYEKDVLCVVFSVKDVVSPSYAQGTQVVVPLELEENLLARDLWHAKIISAIDKIITVEITSPVSAVVGEWTVGIDTRLKEDLSTTGFHHKVKDPVIILFNPWCEGDSVYLPIPEHREEYVMNDSGLFWRGTHSRLRQCVWNYAQGFNLNVKDSTSKQFLCGNGGRVCEFEENILECCLYLLTRLGDLSILARADPVLVVKHMSAVINSRGSTGLLLGNWSGNYKGGQPPTSWGGSQQILQHFYKSKRPAKYGQCWVYAGVLTTVCRALGIPSRPVTHYLSAHQTNGSETADCFIGNEDALINHPDACSIWSFHVWAEVWMQRPDLEPGDFSGWQVVDPTTCGNNKGSGPASVAALKRKEIKKSFDTSNLFDEINAEKVYWRYYGPDQPLKLVKTSLEEVGICISTKAVGKFEREDITHKYKEPECEMKVRNALLQSLLQNKNSSTRYYVNDDFEDVQFVFSLPDDIIIGETFSVKLKASNKNEEKDYSVKISFRVDSILYTGQAVQMVKKDSFEITLAPGIEQEMTMTLSYSEYAKALSDQCLFVVHASAHVLEKGFDFFAVEDFRIRMPHISLQIDGEICQNHPMVITASFTNPLPLPLKKGVFVIEGPGLGKPVAQKIRGTVQPKADAKVTCKVTPKSSGIKTVAVKFHSKELLDVEGYHVISVKSNADVSEKDANSHL